jgi:hypothetical protein
MPEISLLFLWRRHGRVLQRLQQRAEKARSGGRLTSGSLVAGCHFVRKRPTFERWPKLPEILDRLMAERVCTIWAPIKSRGLGIGESAST